MGQFWILGRCRSPVVSKNRYICKTFVHVKATTMELYEHSSFTLENRILIELYGGQPLNYEHSLFTIENRVMGPSLNYRHSSRKLPCHDIRIFHSDPAWRVITFINTKIISYLENLKSFCNHSEEKWSQNLKQMNF